MNNKLERLYPGQEQLLQQKKAEIAYSQGLLGLANKLVPHLEMDEFPMRDEWSQLMREAIIDFGLQGVFSERTLLGLGIGDGRNERLAILTSKNGGNERSIQKVIGVDTDVCKLGLAYHNLLPHFSSNGINPDEKLQLYHGDVVEFLEDQQRRQTVWEKPFAFICLPQSRTDNGGGTTSDVVSSKYQHHKSFWDKYVLTLNASTLSELRKVDHSELDALLVLSGRISPDIRERLIKETGWFNRGVAHSRIVQQDLDTPLNWMESLVDEDDGRRFFADREGRKPLPIVQALDRHNSQQPIFHEVFIYNIRA